MPVTVGTQNVLLFYALEFETNEKLWFVLEMKYRKHLVSTYGNDKLNAYFRHFAGHFICSCNFKIKKLWKVILIFLRQNTKIWRHENIPFYGIIIFNKWIAKGLIRLPGCAGWSAPLLFTNPRQVLTSWGPFKNVCKPQFSLQYNITGINKVSNNFSSKPQGLFNPLDFLILEICLSTFKALNDKLTDVSFTTPSMIYDTYLCRCSKSFTWIRLVVYCWTGIHRNDRALFKNPVPPTNYTEDL